MSQLLRLIERYYTRYAYRQVYGQLARARRIKAAKERELLSYLYKLASNFGRMLRSGYIGSFVASSMLSIGFMTIGVTGYLAVRQYDEYVGLLLLSASIMLASMIMAYTMYRVMGMALKDLLIEQYRIR